MGVDKYNGPLTRYVKLQVAHATGMPGTFFPPPRVGDPHMPHDTCVTHVPWCMPGSLTTGFLWSRWRGQCSRLSWHMRNPHFYVSCKRPMAHSSLVGMKIPVEIYPIDIKSESKLWRIFAHNFAWYNFGFVSMWISRYMKSCRKNKTPIFL